MSKQGEVLRTEVLAILRRSRIPMTAYKVLDELRDANPKIAPTTVYRALTKLTERGRIHRLESLNAFVACQCGQHQDSSILSICDYCGTVEESVAPELLKKLSRTIQKTGFAPMRHVIEVHGICGSCSDAQTRA